MKKKTGKNIITKRQAGEFRSSKNILVDGHGTKPELSRRSKVDVQISGLDDEGYGITYYKNQSLRIAGVLPGDVACICVDHVARNVVFGHLSKLLNPSAMRSKRPPCNESSLCLGCPLIVMKYSEQAIWKRNFVQRHLQTYRELGDVVVHPVASPLRLIHYRTTVRLVIAGKFSEPYIGIYRRASHDIFDLENCAIHHPLVNKAIEVVRSGISKLRVPVYNPRSKMGLLRYLIVRVSEEDQKIMIVFVTARRSFNDIHHLGKFVSERLPEVSVIAQNVNNSEGNVIMGLNDYYLTAQHHLTERIGDVSLMISPRSFFQVNRDGARLIYEKVREWARLRPSETALDLYCGIGGIALTLAICAGKVIGVEVVESAVEDARWNARLNGIANCRFESGDVAEQLEELAEQEKQVDVVVLNPPRKGCDESVLRRIAVLSPRTMIYVSCSPQALARDLNILKKLGYICQEVQPVDMFPQTMHVESVARLEKTIKPLDNFG